MMLIFISTVVATDRYVSLSGTHVSPFTNWVTASTNIQSAVTVALSNANDVVWVTNGVYYLAGEVTITNYVTLKSVNGPAVTIVDGNYPAYTNRCFRIYTNVTLSGFTIRNGRTNVNSGGVRSYGSIITNCIICGNIANNGGGVYLTSGALYNSIITNNQSLVYAGGVCVDGGGLVESCVIQGNLATNSGMYGGGILLDAYSMMRNCLIASNQASCAGGVYIKNGSAIHNCTIVGNRAGSYGGLYTELFSIIVNTVIYTNNAIGTSYNWRDDGGACFTNCCTMPALTNGAGNITNYPAFVDMPSGNYRLMSGSSCINAGMNESWMSGAVDLDGYSRIDRFSGIVDMGCYEYLPQGTMYSVP